MKLPFALAVALPVLALALPSVSARADREVSPEASTYVVDEVHSSSVFRIQHLGLSWFYGRFNDLSGTIVLDEDRIERSSVRLEIQTESVDTNNQKRDDHLRSPDFFDSAKYPTMTFESRKVARSDADTLEVTGDLTIHDVTRSITVEVDVVGQGPTPIQDYRAGFETTFTIDRTDFGIDTYAEAPEGGAPALGREVRITLALETVRQ